MEKIKLAIIGCGKVTEKFHLPAARASGVFKPVVLVDKDLPRARMLAAEFNVPVVEDHYEAVTGQVDAAIIALPHFLHGQVSIDLLTNGIHVLVEKPMSLKTAECDKMIKLAEHHQVVLSVGLLRRYYRASIFVKELLKSNMLGNIHSFDLREGLIFSWKSSSDFMFRKETGGGVLADSGTHALDLLLWWLGDYEEIEYYDNAMGGVESDCEMQLRFQNGTRGKVELSRTRNLRNTCILHGEYGSVETGMGVNPEVRIRPGNHEAFLAGQIWQKSSPDKNNLDVFVRQLEDFGRAVVHGERPFIDGREGRRSVELIEACYAMRRQMKEPWMKSKKEVL